MSMATHYGKKPRLTGGRTEIGLEREHLRKRNQRSVYEVLRLFLRIKSREIQKYLDAITIKENDKIKEAAHAKYEAGEWTLAEMNGYIISHRKTTISLRTIERCLKNDPRIKKDGRFYKISEKARSETRYLNPDWFGLDIYHQLFGQKGFRSSNRKKMMTEFITRIGSLVFFLFVEASRSFEDDSMNIREREEMVSYWVSNVIPTGALFATFQGIFSETNMSDRSIPSTEMHTSNINKVLRLFEKCYPILYRELYSARLRQPVTRLEDSGKTAFIHGKTYHSDLSKFESYLEMKFPPRRPTRKNK